MFMSPEQTQRYKINMNSKGGIIYPVTTKPYRPSSSAEIVLIKVIIPKQEI